MPTNLTAAGLVTHAFLFTGHDRYRRWVLDYAQAWIERIDANGGLLPDNVGPTGRVGERRRGQWWGGLYGWTSRWAGDINFGGPTVAAECALLLSGDSGYLELLRRPLLALLERVRTGAEGRLEFPKRMGPEGWTEWAPPRLLEFAHLYHASMSAADRALIERLREGEPGGDWNHVDSLPDRRSQQAERGRFQYYDGRNPDWPERVLGAELAWCESHFEQHPRRGAGSGDPAGGEPVAAEPSGHQGADPGDHRGAPDRVQRRPAARHGAPLRPGPLPAGAAAGSGLLGGGTLRGVGGHAAGEHGAGTAPGAAPGRRLRRARVHRKWRRAGRAGRWGTATSRWSWRRRRGSLLRAGLRRFVNTPSYGAALGLLKAGSAAQGSG